MKELLLNFENDSALHPISAVLFSATSAAFSLISSEIFGLTIFPQVSLIISSVVASLYVLNWAYEAVKSQNEETEKLQDECNRQIHKIKNELDFSRLDADQKVGAKTIEAEEEREFQTIRIYSLRRP